MVTWRLKSCPRCGGDTFIYEELCDWYEHCLQCGYTRNLRGLVESGQHQDCCGKKKERRVTASGKGKWSAMKDGIALRFTE